MPRWTQDELNAYQSRLARLRAPQPEPAKGKTLVDPIPREAEGGSGTQGRYRISFRIFARRPLDWDNAFVKPLQDLVVQAGLLPGDDWKTLEGSVSCYKARSKAEERTEVLIYPPECPALPSVSL